MSSDIEPQRLGHPLEELMQGLEANDATKPQASYPGNWPCLCSCCSANPTAPVSVDIEVTLNHEAEALTDPGAEVVPEGKPNYAQNTKAEVAASTGPPESTTNATIEATAIEREGEGATITQAAPDTKPSSCQTIYRCMNWLMYLVLAPCCCLHMVLCFGWKGACCCVCPDQGPCHSHCSCSWLPTCLQVWLYRLRFWWTFDSATTCLLKEAPAAVKRDRECVLAAVTGDGQALEHASKDMCQDLEIVMTAARGCGYVLPEVHGHMALKEFMLAAVAENGCNMLRFAAPDLQADKDIWITAVVRDGNDLQYAPEQLRQDKDLVIAAVRTTPEAIQHAMGGLNQVHDCCRHSGMWNHTDKTHSRSEQAILSVKMGLAEQSTPYAMQFALAMRDDPYLGQFKTYNPMVWCQRSCDPSFTSVQHPCRGTPDTCLISGHDNFNAEKRPTDTSCWRVAFRFHQEECKVTNGFMIQVHEVEGLGDGQKIEAAMAEQVGLKVFRSRSHQRSIDGNRIAGLSGIVKAWYDAGCESMELKEVWI